MIRSFFGKKRGRADDGPEGGGSIQERIDALRQTQSGQSESQRLKNGDSPSSQPKPEEEEFLKKFAERMQSHPQRRAPSLPESLAEASREMREALSRRTRETTPTPAPARQDAPPPPPAPSPAPRPAPESSAASHPPEGAILHLSSGENLVFCRDVPNKSYQLVAVLDPDGSVHAEGVYLAAYKYRQIGSLPVERLERLRDERRWARDLVVYHLDRYEDAALIPHPGRPQAAASRRPGADDRVAVAKPGNRESNGAGGSGRANGGDEPVASGRSRISEGAGEEEGDIRGASSFGRPVSLRTELFRGRRFTIKFGHRTWEAVYWGEDEQGAVVAHSTNGQWSLMHLDLSRFRDSLVLKDEISDKERRDLEKSLARSRF